MFFLNVILFSLFWIITANSREGSVKNSSDFQSEEQIRTRTQARKESQKDLLTLWRDFVGRPLAEACARFGVSINSVVRWSNKLEPQRLIGKPLKAI